MKISSILPLNWNSELKNQHSRIKNIITNFNILVDGFDGTLDTGQEMLSLLEISLVVIQIEH